MVLNPKYELETWGKYSLLPGNKESLFSDDISEGEEDEGWATRNIYDKLVLYCFLYTYYGIVQ